MINECLENESEQGEETHQDMTHREPMGTRVGSAIEVVHHEETSGQGCKPVKQIQSGSVGRQIQSAQQVDQAKRQNHDRQALVLQDLRIGEAIDQP